MRIHLLFLAIALVLALHPGMARASGFECNFIRGPAFLPNVFRAEVDLATRSALISIPGETEWSARAKVAQETSIKTLLIWTEQVPDRRKTYAKLDFRLTHFKKDERGPAQSGRYRVHEQLHSAREVQGVLAYGKRNMIRPLILSVLLSFPATTGSAAELHCQVTQVRDLLVGRIAKQISVEFDRSTGVALVRDGFMMEDRDFHYGQIARENSKILAITWKQPAKIMITSLDPIPAPLRLSYRKRDGVMRITGSIKMTSSGTQSFSAAGKCRLQ